jgi:dTMP kinase
MPFIVIEGLDGSGKSTQVARLTDELVRRGQSVEYLHFPRFDAPVYGELIAKFLRGELGTVDAVDPHLVALLFAGDRADAAPTIRRWLADGKWVVTDRYVYSNVAYQCAKSPEPQALREWILELEFGVNAIPKPDVSIFLDVPWSFTESRLAAAREGSDRDYLHGAKDIHEESLDLQKRVRAAYLDLAADGYISRIDCSDGDGAMEGVEENFRKLIAQLNTQLNE